MLSAKTRGDIYTSNMNSALRAICLAQHRCKKIHSKFLKHHFFNFVEIID